MFCTGGQLVAHMLGQTAHRGELGGTNPDPGLRLDPGT
nr:hypothetical protein CPGR_05660 [Mycolicibacter nonchromogenicus]